MTAFFEQPGSRWFNIPAHRPFAEDLAQGLYDALSPIGPEALADAVVLMPTRRGARALADAFIKASDGRAVLPPQMRPLGDLEAGEPPFEPGDLALDLPAAIDPLRRRFELTRLVNELAEHVPGGIASASGALDLAEALGGFFDGLQIEEVDVGDQLASLVDADVADHWRISRTFLEEALRRWPERLRTLGVADVSERRVRLLRRLAEHWTRSPPSGVLVAAGSTGTAPATRALLVAVAQAPRGAVVLPALDQELADKAWAKVDVQHPQGALKRLLDEARIARGDVSVWPASSAPEAGGRWRRRIINEALRPAEETADWLQVIAHLQDEGRKDGINPIAAGLEGLSLVSARTEDEAATTTALLLREALETPGRTAALVTPDQTLARRVTAKLGRWGVVPDSSAGESLAGCRCGVLAGLMARAAVDPVDPVMLLGLLKHPFARLGDSAALEAAALRGPRARSWDELKARVREKAPGALPVAERLETILGGLSWTGEAESPAQAARRTAAAMEALAADGSGGTGELWAGHGGEAMSRLLGGLVREGEALPTVTPRQFADLLAKLMEGETIRSGGATHPRLRILGAIEARLVRADRLVVAGLEEGVWPGGAPLDPFLSRPMRQTLGLPSPERRIGLAAHDFAQAACAPEVILLHTERREGAPSVKSRWLWRLETLARGAGVEIPGRQEVLDWARALDAPGGYEPVKRPSPKPPVADRPTGLFVTRVEALTRDPYAVWARDILRLKALDRPDEQVDVRVRGTAIHAAFERFTLDFPDDLPADAAGRFERLYLEALEAEGMPAEGLARESALAKEAAAWVVDLEHRRRADGRKIHVEKTGHLTVPTAAGAFTVSAKADRIEIGPDGLGHVLDYKTGAPPSAKMVRTGFSPQLTLTAAILAGGGFAEIGRAEPGELTYLTVTGRRPPGREEVRAAPDGDGEKVLVSRDAVDQALAGLVALVERYADPERGYTSRIAPQFVKLYASDYDHLARVLEWSTSGEDGEE
ncbi:double-strand break repair protein AddB [Phenylobacterium kunshanense]|uniref:Double-strand break repair protein AddB n=1 Tax=Phenylobacterium kunshanense TaxID=1445034 RepID=A0A328BE62_9CAUL|nr:double-strand break repair protein AddB [Phenylobacterium kunshanense]RAK64935.1 double-strand break repair protein AddB [Phenylobacterium kunshanense]